MRSLVRRVINEHDPERLLALGAPMDEYDPEVNEIALLLLNTPPECFDDVHCIVVGVWKRWFGYELGEPRVLQDVAQELWASSQLASLN
jgi:hypothetical protein